MVHRLTSASGPGYRSDHPDASAVALQLHQAGVVAHQCVDGVFQRVGAQYFGSAGACSLLPVPAGLLPDLLHSSLSCVRATRSGDEEAAKLGLVLDTWKANVLEWLDTSIEGWEYVYSQICKGHQ